MDNSYSSEDPGAGGFLIGEGKPKAEKVTKKSVNYRHAEIVSLMRCGSCVMFHPEERGAMTGECDLGWNAQRNYVCDRWDPKPNG